MNKNEWYTKGAKRDLTFKRLVDKKLKRWMVDNNITEVCVIHHRDDNDEVKAYNEAHYERWGFDENNEFIEGKYVQFLTRSQHMSYHQSGIVRNVILTAPVRINIELKEQLENTMKQYRHKTGENITISDCINKLINDPNFKQLIE